MYCIRETWFNYSILSHILLPIHTVCFVLIETTQLLILNMEAEYSLRFQNCVKGLNRYMIWKLLTNVCRLKLLLQTITICL
jgi:hypothetical protein